MRAEEADVFRELLYDKVAIESLDYQTLSIEYPGSPTAEKIDELCVRNVPGHFKGAHLNGVPSGRDILASLTTTDVPIAITPYGNADSPVDGRYFAKPYIINRSIGWLLERINENVCDKQYYFQSQDDNLSTLDCPVPKSLGLSTKYLGLQQAANLWIGTQGTTSRLHSDNYDNIYIQVDGVKRIYLMPPSSVLDVGEKMLEPATYNAEMVLVPDKERDDDGSEVEESVLGSAGILFPTFNPATDKTSGNLWVVDLNPGDVLFLPALWYHQVEIISPDVNISLNYWYKPFDDERRWAAWNFARQIAQLVI